MQPGSGFVMFKLNASLDAQTVWVQLKLAIQTTYTLCPSVLC